MLVEWIGIGLCDFTRLSGPSNSTLKVRWVREENHDRVIGYP